MDTRTCSAASSPCGTRTCWRRCARNALTLAERLARHPHVTLTRYPGLASHPTHDAARRQLKGFGTIISFDVLGDASDADAVCARLQLIQHATSLGAVESTIERRASIPGQEHVPPALLRLSVGIEAVEDLWTDLDRALRNVSHPIRDHRVPGPDSVSPADRTGA